MVSVVSATNGALVDVSISDRKTQYFPANCIDSCRGRHEQLLNVGYLGEEDAPVPKQAPACVEDRLASGYSSHRVIIFFICPSDIKMSSFLICVELLECDSRDYMLHARGKSISWM